MTDSVPPEKMGIAEVLQRATGDSAALVRLELALARDELREDVLAARSSAILGAIASVLALIGLAACGTAVGITLGPVLAVVIGAALLLAATLMGVLAVKKFPREPLSGTARRLRTDVDALRGHSS